MRKTFNFISPASRRATNSSTRFNPICFFTWLGTIFFFLHVIFEFNVRCRKLFLRVADNILLSAEQPRYVLGKLVTSLGKVGFKLNAAKTKVLTNQTQPRKTLTTHVEKKKLTQWCLLLCSSDLQPCH